MALTRPKYSQIYDTDWKQSAELATAGSDVGNLTVGNLQPSIVDGVTVQAGYRILVKDQTRGLENGLYTVANVGTGSNGWWTRTLDTAQSNFVTSGMSVVVDIGSTNAGREFRLITPDPITLNSTALTFQVVGTPSGANTAVQFNDGNFFGGSAAFTFNKTSNAVVMSGTLSSGNLTVSAANASVKLTDTTSGNTTTIVGNTASNFTVTLPGVSGALASLGNFAQTFAGPIVLTSALTVGGGVSFNSATNTLVFGATNSTGTITLGQSASNQTINISSGAIGSGNTAIVNIGTNGLTGSNTTINIGSSLSNVNFNITGNTTHSGNLNISNGNLNVTGTIWITGNILPTANVTYNLGSPTNKFKSAYFSGNTVYIGSESMGVDPSGTWQFTSNGATVTLGANAPFNPPVINASGNITSPQITATTNLTAANITAPLIGNVGTTLIGTLSTAAQPSVTSVGSLTNLNVLGNATIGGNLYVVGTITTIGNVNNITITGNAGQFFGNVAGFGALYAGIGTGYVVEPQTTLQISSNFNGYAQLNMQNINHGPQSSADFIVTADNGNANDTYIDMGLASSTYNYPGFGLLRPNDGYLLVYGNTVTRGGNLVLGAGGGGLDNDIIFAVGGFDTANEFGRIDGTGNVFVVKSAVPSTSTTTGAITVAGGVGIAGNLVAAQINSTGNVSAALYVGGAVNVSGNVSASSGVFATVNATGLINTFGNVLATIGAFGTVNSTGLINTSGNILATAVSAGFFNSTGNVSAAIHLGGAVNVSGNVLSTGAIHNTLTVNGTVNTNVASAASTILAGAVGVTGNIIANASVIYGNTSGGYGVRQFFNPITNSLDTVFG